MAALRAAVQPLGRAPPAGWNALVWCITTPPGLSFGPGATACAPPCLYTFAYLLRLLHLSPYLFLFFHLALFSPPPIFSFPPTSYLIPLQAMAIEIYGVNKYIHTHCSLRVMMTNLTDEETEAQKSEVT